MHSIVIRLYDPLHCLKERMVSQVGIPLGGHELFVPQDLGHLGDRYINPGYSFAPSVTGPP